MNSNRGRQSYLVVSVSEATISDSRFIANLTSVSVQEITFLSATHVMRFLNRFPTQLWHPSCAESQNNLSCKAAVLYILLYTL